MTTNHEEAIMTKTTETIIIIHPAGDYYAEVSREEFEKGLLTIRAVEGEELIDNLECQAVFDMGLKDMALGEKLDDLIRQEGDEDYYGTFSGELTPIGMVTWSIARSGIKDANTAEEINYSNFENMAFVRESTVDDEDEGGE